MLDEKELFGDKHMEIAFEEHVSELFPKDLSFMVAALNIQMREHLAPAWGVEPWPCKAYKSVKGLPLGTFWPISILPEIGVPGAAGFHDYVAGLSYGRVRWYGFEETAPVASHEDLELRMDPRVNRWVRLADGRMVAIEVCLAEDTQVLMADSSSQPIEALARAGGEHVILTRNHTGQIVPTSCHGAKRTAQTAEVLRLVFADGDLRCTSDHRIMLFDGSFRPASLLRPGDILADMSPTTTRTDHHNRRSGNPEPLSDLANDLWGFSDSDHISFGQLGIPMSFATHSAISNHSTLARGIQYVLSMGSHKQMLRVGTDRIVARVTDFLAAWNQSFMNLVRNAMDEMCLLTETNLAVAHAVFGSRPIPTSVFLDHAQTKSFLQRLRTSLVTPGKSRIQTSVIPHPTAMSSTQTLSKIRAGATGNGTRSHGKVIHAIQHGGKADVYDLTVPDHHNFAVKPGIFVHNCDPCQEQTYEIEVEIFGEKKSVRVSDFALPGYFKKDGRRPYSYLDSIPENVHKLGLAPGGYLIVKQRNGKVIDYWGKRLGFMKKPRPKTFKKHEDALSRHVRRQASAIEVVDFDADGWQKAFS